MSTTSSIDSRSTTVSENEGGLTDSPRSDAKLEGLNPSTLLQEVRQRLETEAKSFDAYTWQKKDTIGDKILKVLKWIFSIGIAPMFAHDKANHAFAFLRVIDRLEKSRGQQVNSNSANASEKGDQEIATIDFDEYVNNMQFKDHTDNGLDNFYEQILFDLERSKKDTLYNKRILLDIVWINLKNIENKTEFPEQLQQALTKYDTFSQVYDDRDYQSVIRSYVRDELKKYLEQIQNEHCKGMSDEEKKVFLLSFHQSSWSVFANIRQNQRMLALEMSQSPTEAMYARMEDSAQLNMHDDRKTFVYRGLYGQRILESSSNTYTYGAKAEEVVAVVDFKNKTVNLTTRLVPNPKAGKPLAEEKAEVADYRNEDKSAIQSGGAHSKAYSS